MKYFLTPLLILIFFFICQPARGQINDSSDVYNNVARAFVNDLADGQFAQASEMFDETVQSLLSVDQLAGIWQDLLVQSGPFCEIDTLHNAPFQNFRVVFVTCRFENGTLDLKVVLDPRLRIAGFFIIPTKNQEEYQPAPYVDRSRFRTSEITIGEAPWQLPGTFTLPLSKTPLPAVVLVHGSGPNDRDETIGPNKPFRDLAEGLSSRGIAVLRYDKRTAVYGDSIRRQSEKFTVYEETIADALHAVSFLRGRSEIDPSRIYVLGHSLGGMMVPRIAQADSISAGYIIMAGSTRPLEDVIIDQMSYLFQGDSNLTESEQSQLDTLYRQSARVKNLQPGMTVARKYLPLEIPAAYWLDLNAYHPVEAVAAEERPILVLHAQRDYQVTRVDLDGWRRALADHNEATIISFPGLNHLFISGSGKSNPTEYQTHGYVAAEVITAISNWINGL